MALAPYFDKAALAASHILNNFDITTFSARLNDHAIGLYFDDSVINSTEGNNTLDLCINLLSRLYPKIVMGTLGTNSYQKISELTQLAKGINPKIEICLEQSEQEISLVVGNTPLQRSSSVFYIGSDGWIVKGSSHNPVGSGKTRNPFGAGAAACFGAANVFRQFFKESLPSGKLDDEFTLSLLNYETDTNKFDNQDIQSSDLGETHLVGLGAIGNGVIWGLSHVPNICGSLHLIDDEQIETSNCQRYILTTTLSEGISKVSLAADALKSTNIKVISHNQRWGEYLQDRKDWNLLRVGVAVDSLIDRCAIQASLPRWIANAWTQTGDLGISRHDFIGDQACLMCLYIPEGGQKAYDQLIADAIGLPQCVMEVREMLYLGKPLDKEFMSRIAAALNIPVDPLLQFEGKPLQTFYSEAVCGGIILRLGGDPTQTSKAEVPMAFQSALAGIMLAAELVTHAGKLRKEPLPAMTKIDLLRPLGKYLSINAKKHSSGFCICQDLDYISAYKNKYLA